MGEVRRALLSVSNKEGLADFAKGLYDLGFELTASEGTASFLRAQRIPVRNLEEVTGIGSILGGRVKTLHPKVHAGILAIPTNAQHAKDLATIGAERFDLVVVNLYPFEQTVAQRAPEIKSIPRAWTRSPARVAPVLTDSASMQTLR